MTAGGVRNVAIKRIDRRITLVKHDLYVPEMEYNLLSLGQLVVKGFTMIIHQDCLEMFDFNQMNIQRASVSKNEAFQANIKAWDNLQSNTWWKVCEVCLDSKQPKNSLKSQLQMKDINGLDFVHLDERGPLDVLGYPIKVTDLSIANVDT
ncbi:hypothetical protein CR513_46839, partial [Mucuna pruriens]